MAKNPEGWDADLEEHYQRYLAYWKYKATRRRARLRRKRRLRGRT